MMTIERQYAAALWERCEQLEAQNAEMTDLLKYIAKWMKERPSLSTDLDRQVKWEIYRRIQNALAGGKDERFREGDAEVK